MKTDLLSDGCGVLRIAPESQGEFEDLLTAIDKVCRQSVLGGNLDLSEDEYNAMASVNYAMQDEVSRG